MKLTKTGIGLLTRLYRSVLKKCFLINAGLFFALAPSAADATALPRQVINSGQTVNSISGSFSNHTSSNLNGYFIYNAGTINSADVVMQNNQSSSTGGGQSLIYNGGTINSLTGSAIGNTWTSTMGTESDDGILLYSDGAVGTINMTVQNNSLQSTNVDSSAPAGLLWFRNTVDHIYGTYSGNTLTANGIYGGYYNWGLIVTDRDVTDINATISNNTVNNTNALMTVQGGALTHKGGTIGSVISSFTGNSAQSGHNALGGAIYNVSTITSIGSATNHATFTGNYAKGSFEVKGGAIYNTGTIDSLKDSNFVGNYVQSTSSTAQGGAIYNDNKIGIDAVNSNVYFYNNRAIQGSNARYNDIYNTGTLELNANANNSIIFNGSIEGSSGKININTDNLSGGTYVFNNAISGNSVTIGSSTETAPVNIQLGTVQQADGSTSYGLLSGIALTNNGLNTLLDLRNENIDTHSLTTLTLNNQMNLAIDAQLSGASGSADRINVSGSKTAAANSLIVSAINLDNTTYNGSSDKVTIQLTTDSTLKNAYTLSSDIMNNISGNNYYTSVTYDKTTGSLIFDDKLINHSTLDSILANNYYTNVEFSMAKNPVKVANDNNFTTLNCVKEA